LRALVERAVVTHGITKKSYKPKNCVCVCVAFPTYY
jgi:hypothetical protein